MNPWAAPQSREIQVVLLTSLGATGCDYHVHALAPKWKENGKKKKIVVFPTAFTTKKKEFRPGSGLVVSCHQQGDCPTCSPGSVAGSRRWITGRRQPPGRERTEPDHRDHSHPGDEIMAAAAPPFASAAWDSFEAVSQWTAAGVGFSQQVHGFLKRKQSLGVSQLKFFACHGLVAGLSRVAPAHSGLSVFPRHP